MGARDLSWTQLRDVLDYDEATGAFTRKVRLGQTGYAGARADLPAMGSSPLDYRCVRLFGVKHWAHRLAWFYVHGEWPKGVIDHINGNPNDNRIANLRDVTVQLNIQNQRRAHRRKASTHLIGAFFYEKRKSRPWLAAVMLKGKRILVGWFDTAEEAHAAYVLAKRRLHDGCTI